MKTRTWRAIVILTDKPQEGYQETYLTKAQIKAEIKKVGSETAGLRVERVTLDKEDA